MTDIKRQYPQQRMRPRTEIPVASLGRYFSFWAGVPNRRMPLKPMDWWAPRVMPTPRSCIPTISTSLAYWIGDIISKGENNGEIIISFTTVLLWCSVHKHWHYIETDIELLQLLLPQSRE